MTTSQQDPILTGGLNTHCEQKEHFIVVHTWTCASISDTQTKKLKKGKEERKDRWLMGNFSQNGLKITNN